MFPHSTGFLLHFKEVGGTIRIRRLRVAATKGRRYKNRIYFYFKPNLPPF